MDLTAFCNYPELKPGVVIYFKDRAGKTRTEVVFDRTGENLKVRNALKKMTIVNVKNIIGYWDKDVKATRQTEPSTTRHPAIEKIISKLQERMS